MTDRAPDGAGETVDGADGGVVEPRRDGLARRTVRGLLLVAGVAVFAVGLATVVVPERVGSLPVEEAVDALGSDYVLVAVVGLLAVGLAALVVLARHRRGVSEANPPVVEGVQSATYPGESVDRSAGGLWGVRGLRSLLGRGSRGRDLHDRLGDAAVRATMRSEGCTRGVAEERVADGTWTDDPVAARCLSDPCRADGGAGRGDRGPTDEALRRTVDALAELTDVEVDPTPGADEGLEPEPDGGRTRAAGSTTGAPDAPRPSAGRVGPAPETGDGEPRGAAESGVPAEERREGETSANVTAALAEEAPSGGGDASANGVRAASDGATEVRSTGRWRGVVAVVLLAAAVGVLAQRPSLLLVAGVGVVLAAYPLVTTAPDPELSVARTVSPQSPADGEPVAVRTTVRNEGGGTLADLRVVDGVPPTLSVSGGSPRCATALRPGEEATVEYEVRARPGRHRFQPTTLLCRDASGSVEVETSAAARTTIECASHVPEVPLRARSRRRAGPLVTDESGSGVEFHAVSEYERGDPADRIDWRRFARTGELTSVEFRAERLADVVICVDARPEAYRASDPSKPHAVAHAVDAAERVGEALLDDSHRVGLAALGRVGSLLPPGSGSDHAERFRRRLATDPAFSLAPPAPVRAVDALPSAAAVDPPADGDTLTDDDSPGDDERDPLDRQLTRLRAELGADTQVILVSPLCDDEAHRIARRLESGGPAVTVVSPDVTTGRTAGGRLARLERADRLAALRNAGVPAVDWSPDEPLGTAMEAAGGRGR